MPMKPSLKGDPRQCNSECRASQFGDRGRSEAHAILIGRAARAIGLARPRPGIDCIGQLTAYSVEKLDCREGFPCSV